MLAGYPLSIPGLTLLCPDAVVVALRVEQLTPGEVVAVHIAGDAREPLHAVSGGPKHNLWISFPARKGC